MHVSIICLHAFPLVIVTWDIGEPHAKETYVYHGIIYNDIEIGVLYISIDNTDAFNDELWQSE